MIDSQTDQLTHSEHTSLCCFPPREIRTKRFWSETTKTKKRSRHLLHHNNKDDDDTVPSICLLADSLPVDHSLPHVRVLQCLYSPPGYSASATEDHINMDDDNILCRRRLCIVDGIRG